MDTRTLRAHLLSFMTLCVVGYGSWATVSGTLPTASAAQSVYRQTYTPAPANTAVLTYKNDINRTGLDSHETILTPSNVNGTQFGRRVTFPVQGQVDAQPLFVPNLMINGVPHNVVFIATESDNVYAFDADATTPGAPLWQTSLLYNGEATMKADQLACPDLQPESGITSTPVIDPNTNTMYVVAYSNTTPYGNPTPIYRLHALDLTSGKDKSAPIVITGNAQGQHGPVPFNALRERERAALLLTNGQIYVPFGSFCDNDPYEGRIYSYSFNGSAFRQNNLYDAAPDGEGKSGLWGAGGAIAADTSGNVYGITANGDFNLNSGGTESGDSIIKLNGNLQRQDYFTPFQQNCLNRNDIDLGSGGPLIIPGENKLISAGKEGRIYVVDTNSMGQYSDDPKLDALLQNPQFAYSCTTTQNPQLESAMATELSRTDVDHVFQETAPNTAGFGLYGTPAYWKSGNGESVYFIGNSDRARAFALNNGRLSSAPTSLSSDYFGNLTGNPVLSSNGTATGSGILWAEDRATNALRAYKANNLAIKLYDSSANQTRDGLGTVQKFTAPTVANGRVFVGTSNSLVIYGLNPTSGGGATAPGNPPYNDVGITNDANPGNGGFDHEYNSYSAQELARAGAHPGDNFNYKLDDGRTLVFTFPDTMPGQPDNYAANGQILTIPLNPTTPHANVLGILGATADGDGYGTFTVTYTDGTSQQTQVKFTDWASPVPRFGNEVAITTSYRNPGKTQENVGVHIYYAGIAVDSTKTLKSITLPTDLNAPATLHVFAVSANMRSS